jgi:queuine/archaeosine tRNA-ribosyltransferase
VFLDSAGFTAMKHWGGYPWTPEQYINMVSEGEWAYWSQMDFCCEPEVAKDRAEVESRVRMTAEHLKTLTDMADSMGISRPTPVLQGWFPSDYQLSAQLAEGVLGGDWPDLVGVGSVCRRDVHGEAGVIAIVRHLDGILPPHVRLHLFGVKSGALAQLAAHPRVESTDSMAWDFSARMICRKAGAPFSMDVRTSEMHRWAGQQFDTVSDALS